MNDGGKSAVDRLNRSRVEGLATSWNVEFRTRRNHERGGLTSERFGSND